MLKEILKKFGGIRQAASIVSAEINEIEGEAGCMGDLLTKREGGFKRQEERAKYIEGHGAVLDAYTEEDKLTNPAHFQEKALECHGKHSRFRRLLRSE